MSFSQRYDGIVLTHNNEMRAHEFIEDKNIENIIPTTSYTLSANNISEIEFIKNGESYSYQEILDDFDSIDNFIADEINANLKSAIKKSTNTIESTQLCEQNFMVHGTVLEMISNSFKYQSGEFTMAAIVDLDTEPTMTIDGANIIGLKV